ncbi:hypothetical protein V8D89_004136, partial [Ganoderma adspersum]
MFVFRSLEFGGTSTGTTARTHCCPVHTLPTELLGEIFTVVIARCNKTTDLTYNIHSGLVNTTDIHPPLALSQTCHRWRDIALDMPELWMALSNTVVGPQNRSTQVNRHLFVLLLARAKQLPLSVFLTTDTCAANKLTLHMDHVRSLELIDFSDPCKLDPLVRPAPALEYLLLTSPSSLLRQSTQQAPVLFAGEAPSLRALALLDPAFLPQQPFPTLTDLHVGRMSKPHLQDLLELLRASPALEFLAITDLRIPRVGLWLLVGQPQLAPVVTLARLRRLALVRTPLARGIALLAHLAVPREAAVHLLELFTDRNVNPLVTPLPQLLPVAAANALEMVVCGTTLAFRARVRSVDGSFLSVPRAQCTADRGAHTYGWWKGLWQTLPCARLTELRVAVDAEDDEVLPRFLDAAIVLTTLELRLHPRDHDSRASSRGENASARLDGAPQALLGVCALLEQELPVVCPCLAELAVIDAFSTPSAWNGFLSGEDTSPRVAYIPDMLCVIAVRAAAGRGIRRVALQGLWPRAQRKRVGIAFAMGAMVTDFEFRELDAGIPPLFEFEDDREEAWGNGYWTYELP